MLSAEFLKTKLILKTKFDMEKTGLFNAEGKALSIADVMRSLYFDIPDSEMSYATYSTKAYFDEQGWYLIDCDGKKQYEDEKWLRISQHYA